MSAQAELRVLTGLHAGARAPVAGGERVGAGDGCDLILTDLGLPGDVGAWIQLAVGRWSVRSAPHGAEPAAQEAAPAWVAEQAWGAVAYLGQVAITVSEADAPWQAASPNRAPRDAVTPAQHAAKSTAPRTAGADATASPVGAGAAGLSARAQEAQRAIAPPPGVGGQGQAQAVVTAGEAEGAGSGAAPVRPPSPQVRARWLPALVIGAALAALLLSVFWSLLKGQGAQRAAAEAVPSETRAVEAERQQRLLREIQLAVARVDPGLRLRVETLPAGGARVSGWVADIAQLDRLAEGLAGIRPPPALSVRTASDLMDDLVDAGGPEAQALRFELLGEGRVRAHGLVLSPGERDKVLALVRARVPQGIEIVDGLRVAAAQGSAVQEWLRTAGFAGAEARWDGNQMVIGLDIGGQERNRLESLLARAATPLAGIPFVLRAREVARAPAVVSVPAAPAHASAAPLPFSIRSVVGGEVPYIVLGDGSKLQPGGRRAGWRLVAVESDRIVFDGPRPLVVRR